MKCEECGEEMQLDENSGEFYWVCNHHKNPIWIKVNKQELVE
jgi:hypothetical protein